VTISTLIVALYVGMAILVFTTGERVERSGGSATASISAKAAGSASGG
jgi:hypothetical protein